MKKMIFMLTFLFLFIIGQTQSIHAYTIVNGTFTDPAGMTFGTYLSGAEGYGWTPPTAYTWTGSSCAPGTGSCFDRNANARDWFWVQDTSGPNNAASTGIIYDLGGKANKVVVFPLIDHGPVGPESWEYNVYLSNDLATWLPATLVTYYTEGWSPDPNISDGYTTVWELGPGLTARYASITAGNNGNPDGSFLYNSFDNEIDAIAGLTESGGGIDPIPEPSTIILMGSALISMVLFKKKKQD